MNEIGAKFSTYRDRKLAYRVLMGYPRETDHLEDWGLILKRTFKKCNRGYELE